LQPEDRFDSSSNGSTTKLWRLSPWPNTTAVHQVNLPFSYYHRSKGTSLPTGDEEPYDMRETLFVRSPSQWKKHKLCLSIHRRNRKDRQAYSLLLQTTMESLPHGLWSCSSKPLTGRTGHQLKDASTTGTTGDTTASTGIVSPTTGQGLVS